MAKSFLCRVVDYVLVAGVVLLGVVLAVPLWLSIRLRQWFFVHILAVAARVWSDAFEGTRRATMDLLDEVESRDPQLRAEGAVRLLEIGAGSGANLRFMRRKVKYWNVDPNTEFESAFRDTLRKYPQVEMERWVAGYGENMHEVPDKHFDVVLMTHLLCSVDSAEKVLQESRRVLVEGGRLLFMEHVAQPEGSVGRLLQELLNPLWRLMCCGCCLTRDSGELIKRAGFSEVHIRETRVDMPVIISRHVIGCAVA